MRDYAELISDLRRHHCDAKEDDTQEVCEECAYDVIVADKSKFNGITDVCTCGLMHRAADAIEELLAEVKHWELEAAANETDRNYLIDENRKLVNSLMNFRVAMWISVEEQGLPETYFKGVRSQEEFLVVVAKRWSPRDEWEYHTDTALNWGTYIDDFWDTQNDWHEGEEVHVVAYMPFPDPLRIPPKEDANANTR